MAQTTPPSITAAPTPAPQRNDRSTFSARVDAFVTWLTTAVAQFSAVATNVYNNAVDAYNNAVAAAASAVSAATQATQAAQSAAAAVATANSTLWVTGTTYALGANVYSPIAPQFTYRRIVAGAGSTDPSADATNWAPISGGLAVYDLITATGAWVCPRTGFYKITVQDGGNSGETNSGVSKTGSKGGAAGVRLLWLVAGVSYTATVGAAGAINGATTNLAETVGGASSFSGSGITTLTSGNATFKAAGGRADTTVGGNYGASFMSPNATGTGSATLGYGVGGGATSAGAAGSSGMPGAVLIEG